ncbi:hypothetical protein VKT23_002764 [Stygiomarasmius scandens]|uniref:Uncharacterized protein n=1 Tax=Marasmiellus scandens TaxID=2682957 RepID=A0ABR1JVX9_9AGAR
MFPPPGVPNATLPGAYYQPYYIPQLARPRPPTPALTQSTPRPSSSLALAAAPESKLSQIPTPLVTTTTGLEVHGPIQSPSRTSSSVAPAATIFKLAQPKLHLSSPTSQLVQKSPKRVSVSALIFPKRAPQSQKSSSSAAQQVFPKRTLPSSNPSSLVSKQLPRQAHPSLLPLHPFANKSIIPPNFTLGSPIGRRQISLNDMFSRPNGEATSPLGPASSSYSSGESVTGQRRALKPIQGTESVAFDSQSPTS